MSRPLCLRCGHEPHPQGDCPAGVWPADQSGPTPCRCDPAWFEVFTGSEVVKPRFEDGTTGRPLGDDEDLDPRAYDDIAPRPRLSALGNEPDWADIVEGRSGR